MNLANPWGDLTPDEAAAMHDRLAADMPGVAEWIAARVGDRTVLDYGCGTGADAPLYAPDKYVGIDVSEPLLAEARRRYPSHRFEHATAPWTLDPAECVIFKAVLEHTPTAEVARTLLDDARSMSTGPVFVAWHTPPRETARLQTVVGASGREFPQNAYALADFAEFPHDTHQVCGFEVWEMHP